MDIFVFLFSLFLIILGMGILRNWKTSEVKELNYSIIIACRNEEKNLPKLFNSLENLDYPKEKFEIIIVDDASTDKSLNLIEAFCEKLSNARSFHLKEKSKEYLGKKVVVTEGIAPEKRGRVEFRGSTWKAEAYENLAVGATVEIVDKNNITLIVKSL